MTYDTMEISCASEVASLIQVFGCSRDRSIGLVTLICERMGLGL